MDSLTGNAISIAMQLFKAEYGEDETLQDGEEFVTCFENGTLILSLENEQLGVKLIGGKAYQSDYEIPIFKEATE